MWQGLVSGAAGATVMTLGEKVEQRFTGRPDSFVPARVLQRLTGATERSADRSRAANWTMHLGRGALIEVLRSVMAHAAVVGILVGSAAVFADPRRAGGLDAALRALGETGPGEALLIVIALGFAAYGIYCLADAATRRA